MLQLLHLQQQFFKEAFLIQNNSQELGCSTALCID